MPKSRPGLVIVALALALPLLGSCGLGPPPATSETRIAVASQASAKPLPTTAATRTSVASPAAAGPLPTTATRTSVASPAAAGPLPTTPSPVSRAWFVPTRGKTPLEWARLLVEQVQPSSTGYQHTTGPVTWAGQDGATGYASQTDCSGFVIALLAQAYALTPDDFGRWLGRPRPLAATFYAAINGRRGFVPLQQAPDIQPGDFIAIKYPNPAAGDNTGHILLVAGPPQPREATVPVIAGTRQWDVPIIDQSESGHGATDTRVRPDGTFRAGIGQGMLRLYTTPSGAFAGYTWSDYADSVYYAGTARPLAIGRLDATYAPIEPGR